MKKLDLYIFLILLAFVTIPQSKVEAACTISAGTLAYSQSNSAIKDLQTCLASAGYAIPAGASGYYGAQTKSAVQKFYAEKLGLSNWHGLSVGPLGKEKLSGLTTTNFVSLNSGYKKAGDEATFKKYLAENSNSYRVDTSQLMRADAAGESVSSQSMSKANSPLRVSETTVQITGVDEPDIVKTDGENIFYSRNGWYGGTIMPMVRTSNLEVLEDSKMMMPYPMNPGATNVISAFPPSDLEVSEKIPETGDLLLDKKTNTLVILAHPKIIAYDVTNENKPKKLWDLEIPQNSSLLSARLNAGKIYLVTQTWIDSGNPCPLLPISGSRSMFVPCADIYVPMQVEPISDTYTILTVDQASGNVEKKLAFASDGSATTIMMSKENLYLATKAYTESTDVMLEVLSTVAIKYLSAAATKNINEIKGYQISLNGKLNEVSLVIQNDLNRLDPDARLKAQTDFNNDVTKEMSKRQRELETTRLARIALATLSVEAVGTVPGTLLNQFSLDEYNGDLRVSTTVGGNNWFAWGAGGESVNDVYVLGSDLKKKGEVLDLGRGERIYSTRFMGDQGYVVTFRQIDPFYILDLSNPYAPKLSGELKIPGYSSYLEKISDDLVLGVGREDNNVKISLFDVSVASSPKEVAKYLLKGEWSEVESNHHAFMLDAANKTFFIPGVVGGYFFSYANNDLRLASTVALSSVTRAIYIDDYYYVIGNDAIKVLDLKTWKEVSSLNLN